MPRRRWLSIEYKLPLIISALLLVVIAALAGGAYREMRRLALLAARERLAGLAEQLATSFADGARRRITALNAAAARPALSAYLSSGSPGARAAAMRELALLLADTQVVAARLRSAAGVPVLAAGDTAGLAALLPAAGPAPDSLRTGPLVARGDRALYATLTPVESGGRTVGTLAAWRRIGTVSSPRARQQIAGLLGSNAVIYYANAAGDVWVDLAGGAPVTATPSDPGGATGRPGAGGSLTAVRPIAGTPWVVAVEFPRATVLAPAHAFLLRVALLAALLVAAGAGGGWLFSRRITAPLREITWGAEAIAGGDYSRVVQVNRNDELGRLAGAFTVMSQRVHDAQQRLEDQVAQRTAELSEAVKRLERAQDELVRKERLAILGQLSSGVGHELRNPLGVMTNAVYYLEAVLGGAPQKVKEYLGILRSQITLSEKIVGDLLDFARVKPARGERVPLERAVEEQLARVSGGEVRVIRRVAPDLAAHADPVHVGQILGNLIENACQAMGPAGGTLTVSAASGENGRVQVEVADTGPGIAPEHLDQVFEPLFTTKPRGIGLGLAVSQSLAAANGGGLTVHSRQGQGATFTLALPAAPEPVSAA